MKRFLKIAAIVLAVAFVAIQLVPVDRENPPVTSPLQAPAPVAAILKRSCYDCHSNETVWPWYAYVAPVSWLVADDVEHGRKELNFSKWGEYSADKRMAKAEEMLEQIDEGEMPMPNYVRLHDGARLSAEDVRTLRAWADSLE